MEELFRSLLELQELDKSIAATESRLAEFEPRFDDLEAPVKALETEFEMNRTRLAEMQQEVRRLERGAAEKRDRLQRFQEHLERARTLREDAAARAEIDLVRKAAEADEAEALELMDQVKRTELKLDELEERLGAARAEVEPKRRELEEARSAVETELATLRDRRANGLQRLDPEASRLYQRVSSGRTRVVVAGLTPDGACGHCFGIIPLQQQAEIRRAESLIRCEACGVILYPGD